MTLFDQTVAVLVELGFNHVSEGFYDSPGEDWAGSVVQAYVYKNAAGTVSVDLDGGYMAPILGDDKAMFMAYLDQYFPGWR